MASRKDVDIRISATDATASGFNKTRAGLQSISTQLEKFRNEVKVVGAAVIAFQAAIIPAFGAIKSQFGQLVSTGREFETLRAQFSGLMGSIEAGEEAIAWVDRFAEGVPFQTSQVAEAFVKLKAFGLDPTNGSLEALTNQAALLGGSQETLEGVILAVGQAWAKQKLQGEEILQLVERGVPVWELLEKATGKNAVELQKLSSEGKLGRDVIAKLLAEINKFAGGAAGAQLGTLNGQLALVSDNFARFQTQIGKSGLNDFIRDVAAEVNNLFSELRDSGQLEQIARSISDTLVSVGAAARDAIKFVVEFKDEIILAFKVVAGLSLAALSNQLAALGTLLASAARGFYALATSAITARSALLSMRGAMAVVGAAFAGWEIGTYLREKFVEVERAGIALMSGLHVAFERLKQFLSNIPDYVTVGFIEMFDYLSNSVSSFVGELASLFEAIPGMGEDIANGLRSVSASIASGVGDSADAIYTRIAQRNQEFEDDIQSIKDSYADLFALAGQKEAAAPKQSASRPSPGDLTFGADQAGGAPAAAAVNSKLQAEKQRIESELQAVQDRLARAEADTLDERLALIRSEYSKLITDLEKIGDTAGVDTVEKLVAIEQQNEKIKYQQEQQAAAEQKLNELISTRKDLLSTVDTELQAGLESQAGAQQRINDINAQYVPLITTAADEARRLADNLGDEAAVAKLDAIKTGVTAVKREVVITGEQIDEKLSGGLSNALLDVATGAASAKDAFKAFAADFLRQIANMILQATILKALQSAFGGAGVGGTLAGGINALVAHSGAMVGGRGGSRRMVPAMMFSGAPRYHSGGIAGLKPNEVPAILEKGEQVVPKDQVGASPASSNVKIVNTIDSQSVVSQGLNTSGGQKAIINVIRANKSSIRSILA